MLQRTMVAQFRLISFVDLGQFRAEPRTRTILDMHMHTGYIPYSFPKLCSLEVISSSLSCAASRLQTFLLVRSGLVVYSGCAYRGLYRPCAVCTLHTF